MRTVTRRGVLKVGVAGAGALVASGLGFDVAFAESTKVKQNLRIAGAKESHSICPYCAVGCSLVAYTRQNSDGSTQLLQIEGDPDSPVNEGRLCPKGATAMQLAVSPRRVESPQYRASGAKIGAGSIVAAGTLVPENTVVPPGSLFMGHPGKFRRALTPEDQASIEAYAARYIEYSESYKKEVASG